jgi:hypothetical protein
MSKDCGAWPYIISPQANDWLRTFFEDKSVPLLNPDAVIALRILASTLYRLGYEDGARNEANAIRMEAQHGKDRNGEPQ